MEDFTVWWNEISNVVALLVTGGPVTVLFGYIKDRRKTQLDVKHLAIELAYLLEEYAINCCELASQHDLAEQSAGHAGQFHGQIPKLPDYPESGAFKNLDLDLLNSLYALPQRILIDNQQLKISF